jgi:small-conductance mechanosensitive channel
LCEKPAVTEGAPKVGREQKQIIFTKSDKSLRLQAADSRYSRRHRIADLLIVFVSAGVVAILAEHFSNRPMIKPYIDVIYAGIIIVAGYLVIRILTSVITRFGESTLGTTRTTGIRNFIQIVLVLVILAVISGLFGLNIYVILAGAGFGAIVLGLAAQQVLGNIFAGISLIISRPFDVGDRVTMTMSQYSLIGPSYSHEALVPGYTGVVVDIGIFYTSMLLDDGAPTVLPNSAVIGAMVFNHTKAQDRAVKVRIDVDKGIAFNKFRDETLSRLRALGYGNKMDLEKMNFEITDLGPDTYQVSILIWTTEKFDEVVKTLLFPVVIEVQRDLAPPTNAEKSDVKDKT